MASQSKVKRWRWWLAAIISPVLLGVGITFAIAVAQSVSVEGGLADLERSTYGWMLLHRPSRPVDSRIAFVAVDTKLYEEQEAPNFPPEGNPGKPLDSYREKDCDCPGIPRLCYALAVERLHRWGAKAVVLDIMFRTKVYSDVDKAENQRLAEALFKANNVVAAAGTQTLALDRSRDPRITTNLILTPPVAAVADNAFAVGSPQIEPQNKEYALEFLQTARDNTGKMVDYFSLPYLGYCVATQHPQQDLSPWKNRMVSGTEPRLLGDTFSKSVPAPKKDDAKQEDQGGVQLITTGNVTVDEAFYQKHLLINFSTGANADEGRFRPIRLSWLLSCPDAEGAKRFKGKIVLVGDPATDLHSTLVGALPGTEVLANAVQTLVQDSPIVPASNRDVLVLTCVLAVLAAAAMRSLPFLVAAIFVGLEVFGLAGLSFELLKRDVWFLAITPMASVAATGVVTGLAQMKGIQKMVAQLVPERISRAVEHAGGLVVEEGTVMFSDIRGYSTFSEYMDPATMMSMLNAYFGSVNAILDRYNGHFIKSPGDCVVAWFSDERKGAHHSERAIRAAIDLVINAVRFRDQWPAEQGGQEFDIGVGMNSGPMAIGLLDAHRHVEPTIIGDTVNLASRIESLTKTYHATVIVSEDTLNPVREKFLYEPLGATKVKGREQPVELFRIVGIAPGEEEELAAWDLRRFRHTRMWFGRERKVAPAVPQRIEALIRHPAPKAAEPAPEKPAEREPEKVGAAR